MPLYWTQREALGEVDWKALPAMSLFIYEVLFSKNYFERVNDVIKLSYDKLDPDKIALWALVKRSLDPMITHSDKYHRKRDGLPLAKHPKYEGGKHHVHDLGVPYYYYLREFSSVSSEDEDIVDLRSVTPEEFEASRQQLTNACGLKILASNTKYSDVEDAFGRLEIG